MATGHEIPLITRLIAPGIHRLRELGIEPEVEIDEGLSEGDVDAFREEFGIAIPDDMRALFLESDGFSISWDSASNDLWGEFTIPSLYELRLFRQRWLNGQLPDESWATHLPPMEAAEIIKRMSDWLPFDDSSCGNLMCVDSLSGAIVEYDHEWGRCDGRNGLVFADSYQEYIERCGGLCFQDIWLMDLDEATGENGCRAVWSSAATLPQFSLAE